MSPTPTPAAYFERFGRSLHLRMSAPADMLEALSLDDAHWVATSAPVATLDADDAFLSHLSRGADRVRSDDVRAAIEWCASRFVDMNTLDQEGPLSADELVSGTRLRRAFARAHAHDANATVDLETIQTRLTALSETVTTTPLPAPTPSLTRGVDEELEWRAREDDARTFGEHTELVEVAHRSLDPRVRHYLRLSAAARIDPRVAERAWHSPTLEGIDLSDPAALDALLESTPIARPDPSGVLDLTAELNPRDVDALETLRDHALDGADRIDALAWEALTEQVEGFRQWRDARPNHGLDDYSVEQLEGWRLGEDAREELRDMLTREREAAEVLQDLRLLERALLYRAHLFEFTNSFVSFPRLYDPNARALFERGSLVMDGRRFELALRAPNRERHTMFSDASNMFVLYVEIGTGDDREELAIPVTSGGRGNLLASKWGVFIDIEGEMHHARVVHIVDNPISLWEAIVAPFKKLAAGLEERLEKLSESRQDAFVEEQAEAVSSKASAAESAAKNAARSTPEPKADADPSKPQPENSPGAPAPAAGMGGALAGGGIALAAMGSSLAFVTKTFESIGWQAVAIGLLVVALLVLTPVVVVAIIKLRQRDLSALLEGSGWAINGRMKLTRAQARTFTHTPRYPQDAQNVPRRLRE